MESPQLSINWVIEICPECLKLGDILIFECGHNICTTCYFNYWKKSISNLKKILADDFTKLDGKSGSIGCKNHCERSFVSIPPIWLERFFEKYNLEELCQTVNFLSTFLSGFKTYIYKCDRCNFIHSGLVRGECNSRCLN